MYDPELFRLYFYNALGQAAVRPELPLYPDHMVVGLLHCSPPRSSRSAALREGGMGSGASSSN